MYVINGHQQNFMTFALDNDDGGAIDEIMLPNEEEEYNEVDFVMNVNLFGDCKSKIINLLYGCLVFLCFIGLFINNRPNIQMYNKTSENMENLNMPFSMTVMLEKTSMYNRMVIFTAKVNKSSKSPESAFTLYSHIDVNHWSYDGKGSTESSGEIQSMVNINDGLTSDIFHIFTGESLGNEKSTYIVNFANATANISDASMTVTSFDADLTKAEMIVSGFGLLIVAIVYLIYRSSLSKSGISDKTCIILFIAQILMIISSNVWVILAGKSVSELTYITKGILIWTQRFVIYILAERQGAVVGVLEAVFFVVGAVVEVVAEFVTGHAFCKFPFSHDSGAAVAGVFSLVMSTLWALYSLHMSDKSFFYTFVLITWFGQGLGVLIDHVQGAFKETCFRFSHFMIPLVVNLFLCVIMWPVSIGKQECENPAPDSLAEPEIHDFVNN